MQQKQNKIQDQEVQNLEWLKRNKISEADKFSKNKLKIDIGRRTTNTGTSNWQED